MKNQQDTRLPESGEALLQPLNEEEMQRVYVDARSANNLCEPHNLRTAWEKRKAMSGEEGVKELWQILRNGASLAVPDSPGESAAYLAHLLHAIVDRFELLVQSGAMDEVLPRLTALPVLYSTKAGKGAPEWQWARELFEGKKVGTDAASGYRGKDYMAARDAHWGLLAVEASKVALRASLKMSEYDTRKAQAVAVGRKEASRPGAHYKWSGSLYYLADGGALVWPDWLALCRGLPLKVEDAVPQYQAACGGIVKEFFGDPGNNLAEDLILPKITGANGKTLARARLEAVKGIVAAVGRLGGLK